MIGQLPRNDDIRFPSVSSSSTPPSSLRSATFGRGTSSFLNIDLRTPSAAPQSCNQTGEASASSSTASTSRNGTVGEDSAKSSGDAPLGESRRISGPSSSSDAYVAPPPPITFLNQQYEEQQAQSAMMSVDPQSKHKDAEDQYGTVKGVEREAVSVTSFYPAKRKEKRESLASEPIKREARSERMSSTQPSVLNLNPVPDCLESSTLAPPRSPAFLEPSSPQPLLIQFPLWSPNSPCDSSGPHQDSYFYRQAPLPPTRSFQPLLSQTSPTLNDRASKLSLTEFPSRTKSQRDSKRWSDQSHSDTHGFLGRHRKQRESLRSDALRLEASLSPNLQSGRHDLSLPVGGGGDDDEVFGPQARRGSFRWLLMVIQRAIAPYRVIAPILSDVLFDFNLLFILIQLAIHPNQSSSTERSPRAAWAIAAGVHGASSLAQIILYIIKLYRSHADLTSSKYKKPQADEAYLSYFHRLVMICRSSSLHIFVKRVDQMASGKQRMKETAWRWSQLWQFALLQAPRLVITVNVNVLFAPTDDSAVTIDPTITAYSGRDSFFFNPQTGRLSKYSFAISMVYLGILAINILSVLGSRIAVAFFGRTSSRDLEDQDDDDNEKNMRIDTLAFNSPSTRHRRPRWMLDTQERVRLVLLQNRSKHLSTHRFSHLDPLQSVMVTVTSPSPEQAQEQHQQQQQQQHQHEKGRSFHPGEDVNLSPNSHSSTAVRKNKVSWLQTTPPLLPLALPERRDMVSPFEIPRSVGSELRVTNVATPPPVPPKSPKMDHLESNDTAVEGEKPLSRLSHTSHKNGQDVKVMTTKEGEGNTIGESVDSDRNEEAKSTSTAPNPSSSSSSSFATTSTTSSTSSFLQRFAQEERKAARRVQGPRPIGNGKESFWENWFGSKGERWRHGEGQERVDTTAADVPLPPSEESLGKEEEEHKEESHLTLPSETEVDVVDRSKDFKDVSDPSSPTPTASTSLQPHSSNPPQAKESTEVSTPSKTRPDSIEDLLVAYQNLTSNLARDSYLSVRSIGKRVVPDFDSKEEEDVRLWPAQTVQPRLRPSPETALPGSGSASTPSVATPKGGDEEEKEVPTRSTENPSSPLRTHVQRGSQSSTDDSEEARIWASFPDPTPSHVSRFSSSSTSSSQDSRTHLPLRRAGVRLGGGGAGGIQVGTSKRKPVPGSVMAQVPIKVTMPSTMGSSCEAEVGFQGQASKDVSPSGSGSGSGSGLGLGSSSRAIPPSESLEEEEIQSLSTDDKHYNVDDDDDEEEPEDPIGLAGQGHGYLQLSVIQEESFSSSSSSSSPTRTIP